VEPADTVIEVGAGTGLLTAHLLGHGSRLIAVELDRELISRLREKFRESEVAVVEADVLEAPVQQLLNEGGGGLPYVVVGNLPYFIGTAIVRKFLRDPLKPRRIVATLQAEVAESIAAGPGGMSYLSVEMQLFAAPRLLFRIPPRAFRPPPRVDSAVLLMEVRESPGVEVDDIEAFLELARAGFAAPRKRLRNSLTIGLRDDAPAVDKVLARAGIDGWKRPAGLSLEDWRSLYLAYRAIAEAG
jgi:16S rRNA (adenine1518-N6/adenine1519-N6)-dimethyltransferase